MRLNQLLMVIISALLFFLINDYIPMAPLINLVFNFLLIALLVIYSLQFFTLIKDILPAPKMFK